jgi:hypothetical protein
MQDRFVLMFQEEIAASIFRVNEFGSGSCWCGRGYVSVTQEGSKVFGQSELQKRGDRIDLHLICKLCQRYNLFFGILRCVIPIVLG